MSREDFVMYYMCFCLFAGKYEFFQKRLMFVVDFEYVQGGVTLEGASTLGRGQGMVFVLVVGATQG